MRIYFSPKRLVLFTCTFSLLLICIIKMHQSFSLNKEYLTSYLQKKLKTALKVETDTTGYFMFSTWKKEAISYSYICIENVIWWYSELFRIIRNYTIQEYMYVCNMFSKIRKWSRLVGSSSSSDITLYVVLVVDHSRSVWLVTPKDERFAADLFRLEGSPWFLSRIQRSLGEFLVRNPGILSSSKGEESNIFSRF